MIKTIDHVVLTTRDLDVPRFLHARARHAGRALRRGPDRAAFGEHKFNVHPPGFDAGIKARTPTPGSLDLCFLADRPLDEVIAHLKAHKIPIEEGPRCAPARAFRYARSTFAIPMRTSSRSRKP